MDFKIIDDAIEQVCIDTGYQILRDQRFKNELVVGGYKCYKLISSKLHYNDLQEVLILDERQKKIGILCCFDGISVKTVSECTYTMAIVVINQYDEFHLNGKRFSENYLLIKSNYISKYEKLYKNKSHVWGGFIHKDKATKISQYKSKNPYLVCKSEFNIPKIFSVQLLQSHCYVQDHFIRFLKLYHILELMLNWYFVEKIKLIDQDLYGIETIMSKHESSEISRIKYIVNESINELDDVEIILANIGNTNYLSIFEALFERYKKKGLSISDDQIRKIKDEIISKGKEFNEANLSKYKIANDHSKYLKFMKDFIAYLLYRVRSSIVHRQLGEYLIEEKDQEFVVEIAEPLLRNVIVKVFKDVS